MRTDLQNTDFSVRLVKADGTEELVCDGVSSTTAAAEFWRCTNNVSARTGIVERVSIEDSFHTYLWWARGLGYSYDGVEYRSTPVVQ